MISAGDSPSRNDGCRRCGPGGVFRAT